MKIAVFFLLSIFLLSPAFSQPSLVGAWEGEITNETGETIKAAVIFSEKYQSMVLYKTNGDMLGTQGGTWNLEKDVLSEFTEFDSFDASQVGQTVKTKIVLTQSTLHFPENGFTLNRVDDGNPGKLAGAWLFYSRNIPGSEMSREANHPRKTMKILSGTRFQWIAYDTESKEIFGSGGGTYSTENGKYTEKIEFFAKDPSRSGMELQFNFNLNENDWRHSGRSTKGDPIDETWKRRI